MRLDDPGILRQDVAHAREGRIEIVSAGGAGRLLEPVVERDLVLGVRPLLAGAILQVARRAAAQVAQGLQPGRRVVVDPSWLCLTLGRHLAEKAFQRRRQRGRPVRLAGRQVVGLARVRLQVIQLRPRRPDVLVAAVPERHQLAPAVVVAREPAFRQRRQPQALAVRQRQQVDALYFLRRRQAEPRQQGRQHVDDPHLAVDLRGRDARARDDQRDAHRRLVDEESVGHLAVLAQHLAVIGEHRHQRLPQPALSFECLEQPPDLGVGVGDLGVVGAVAGGRETRPVRFRRLVGSVRVVQVHPGEERLIVSGISLAEPGQGLVDHLGARPLDGVHARCVLEPGEVEVVEEAVEALADPPARVEHEGADEAAGAETRGGEQLGQGHGLFLEIEAAVVAHAVGRRVGAGHQRGVRRQGKRRHRRGAVEAQAARRQPVEVRGLGRGVAVAAQPVGAQGVEGHQEQVAGAGLSVAAGRDQKRRDQKRHGDYRFEE